MDLLRRSLAPVLAEGWTAIDAEASRVLQLHLAGRRLVDVDGPHGWHYAAKGTGRFKPFAKEPLEGVRADLREVRPLVELRVPFRLKLEELDAVGRGAEDEDLRPVVAAAQKIALAEDIAIFRGLAEAGIAGIVEASPHPKIRLGAAIEYPRRVVEAKHLLRDAAVEGPFALAVGPREYDELFAGTEDGYPLLKHIESLVELIVRTPTLEGAVLMSRRGGDYQLVIGQDFSIGFADRTDDAVDLFITESFTFRVLEPAAAVALVSTRS
jgi:uncharacterized linocin/CFP29 family protein